MTTSMIPKDIIPNFDMSRFAPVIDHASPEERLRMLQALHEKFWHAPAPAMVRMIRALGLGADIAEMAALIPKCCKSCTDVARPLNRPMIKASIAVRFNQFVGGDLFFLFNHVYLMPIDDCVRYRVATAMKDKTANFFVALIVAFMDSLFWPDGTFGV